MHTPTAEDITALEARKAAGIARAQALLTSQAAPIVSNRAKNFDYRKRAAAKRRAMEAK